MDQPRDCCWCRRSLPVQLNDEGSTSEAAQGGSVTSRLSASWLLHGHHHAVWLLLSRRTAPGILEASIHVHVSEQAYLL